MRPSLLETRELIRGWQVGISYYLSPGATTWYWGIQPLALDMVWDFTFPLDVGTGVWLVGADGETSIRFVEFVPDMYLQVLKDDRLKLSMRQLDVHGWTLAELFASQEHSLEL